MKVNTFEELLLREMRELYDAEQQIVKALPKMIKAASSAELKSALQEHCEVTKTHVARLEEAFHGLNETAKSETCKTLKALVDEGDSLIGATTDSAVKDAGLILVAQKVEHYEIAAYGSLRSWANRLGHERVAQIFERTLQEEKEADRVLTALAESSINVVAEEHMLKT